MNKSHGRKSGQSLVEFALTLPLLALVLFGICQYGLIFAAIITVRNASAVGARYAVIGTPSASSVQAVAKCAVAPMLNSNLASVVYDPNATVGGTSGAKSVTVIYNLPLIIPFVVPGKSAGSTLTLTNTTVMR
jgi:Flp pilus assembly protein TadG